jgi:hypothetical protein
VPFYAAGSRVAVDNDLSWVSLSDLQADSLNPRLPEELRQAEQLELLTFIEANYNPYEIAVSIARNGYMSSEPLIVLRAGPPHVVLEGNRRLSALKGLADETVRGGFHNPERWHELAEAADVPESVPVVFADERVDAAPIIGFRHIVGIQAWDAYAKARFVGEMVDDPEHPTEFADAAARLGETERGTRALYRNYRISRQARDLDVPADRLEERFGVFTAALNRRGLREFVGAPAPADVQRGADPLPEEAALRLNQLVTWIFGTEDQPSVISDSRDLTTLAAVVESEEGLRELEAGGSLESAFQAAGGPRLQLRTQLARAVAGLESAARAVADADLGEDFDFDDFSELVNRARAALQVIDNETINLPGAG